MKDENDRYTVDMHGTAKPPRKRKQAKPPKRPLKLDEESSKAPLPAQAKPNEDGQCFVPVSFVAQAWGVTPRRIRALLVAGRLAGQLKGNGYWEVRYPYTYTEGLRGPQQKRHQRPSNKPPRLVVDNSALRAE